MVRLFNVYHPSRTFLLICSEVLLILLCFLTALFLRRGSDSYAVVAHPGAILQLLLITGTCVLCLYYFDLYDFQNIDNKRELFRRLVHVLGMASLIVGVVYYLFPDLIVARGIFIMATSMSLGMLFGVRVVFARLNQLPRGAERVVLIGSSTLGCQLAREIRLRPELGINLIGYVDDAEPQAQTAFPLARLGSASELQEVVVRSQATAAIVALQDRRGHLPVDTLLTLRVGGMKIQEARTVYERITGKIPVENLLPSWLIFADGFQMHSRRMALQRACSFVFALIGLIVALPMMAVVALLIKLTSKGPILLRQARVGLHGRVFTLFKFRSMRDNAEAECGAVWTVGNDHRITYPGRYLRKFRLDELPQLWNVLRGDMQLVGPRPERPEFVQRLIEQIPYYTHRHIVRPGITGWAQVRYNYGSTVEEQCEKLRYDLFYLKNISLSLDLYILFQTAKIILRGRGAK